jgi:hypothetical protein
VARGKHAISRAAREQRAVASLANQVRDARDRLDQAQRLQLGASRHGEPTPAGDGPSPRELPGPRDSAQDDRRGAGRIGERGEGRSHGVLQVATEGERDLNPAPIVAQYTVWHLSRRRSR